MSFNVSRITENGLSLVKLQDKATNTIITILPEYGAMLHGFQIPVNGEHLNIIDNYANREQVEQELGVSFKSSKLSPFVCRVRDGKYTLEEEDFEFASKFSDGNAIHGLLYNKPFNVVNEFADDKQASVTLRYQFKREDPGYPYEYNCEVRYTLFPRGILQVETIVLNLDSLSIPIADGWHPYFKLGGVIDDYEMQVSTETMVEFDDKLVPTGKLIADRSLGEGILIGNRQFDNCFVVQPVDQRPAAVLYNPANAVFVSIFTNKLYPYIQIYTPPHRKSIAIENLSGAPDCFNNGMGLQLLTPSRSQTFTVWYQAGVAEND
ncbi:MULTISPECIES: aldose 1-epimerase [Niastella]|uniref:Aldose 1-epimerase n=1 Tax=Niastella soli TaxID=2821487 RepID=A0ABS3YQA6_9BACT|nr:aldose 1-epimerase [Niastella soli]MBO9200072.1 aldose 1-epimerase [Niastella soli]